LSWSRANLFSLVIGLIHNNSKLHKLNIVRQSRILPKLHLWYFSHLV